jgi:hypothetical protein
MFVLGRLFQLGLMFARLETLVEPFSGNQLMGRLLALLANIRLSWEGKIETNAQAYYENSDKKFYNIWPWHKSYKTFSRNLLIFVIS